MVTLLEKILEHCFGHKFYCVTVEKVPYSTGNVEAQGARSISNYIFRNKEDAKQYFYQLKSTRTFKSVEIVSFRSREEYTPHDNGWKKAI